MDVRELGEKLIEIQNTKGYVTVDIILSDGTIARGIRVDLANKPLNTEKKFGISKLFNNPEKDKAEIEINGNNIRIYGLTVNGERIPESVILPPDFSINAFLLSDKNCIARISDGENVLYQKDLSENYEQDTRIAFYDKMYDNNMQEGMLVPDSSLQEKQDACKLATQMVMACYLSNALNKYATTNLNIIVKYINKGKECTQSTIYTGPYMVYNDISVCVNPYLNIGLENITGIYTENGELLMENPKAIAEQLYNNFMISEKDPVAIKEEASNLAVEVLIGARKL